MNPNSLAKARTARRPGRWFWIPVALAGLCGCRSTPPPVTLRPGDPAPLVRILLTFDDGPSARADEENPTLAILEQLDANDVQRGIRALFFVQTLHPRGGGTPRGRALMRQIHARGHVLGLHSVSPEGHVAHTELDDGELVLRLADGKRLLAELTGSEPRFVRPPFGARTPRTQRLYEALELDLLLCDLRARDGVIYGFNSSPRRRGHFRRSFAKLRRELPDTPRGAAPHPLVISFHDLNPYTARHMTEYLHIIVEEAARAGLRLADPPFFRNREEILVAARQRRVPPPR